MFGNASRREVSPAPMQCVPPRATRRTIYTPTFPIHPPRQSCLAYASIGASATSSVTANAHRATRRTIYTPAYPAPAQQPPAGSLASAAAASAALVSGSPHDLNPTTSAFAPSPASAAGVWMWVGGGGGRGEVVGELV